MENNLNNQKPVEFFSAERIKIEIDGQQILWRDMNLEIDSKIGEHTIGKIKYVASPNQLSWYDALIDKKGFYWKEETLSQNIISNGKRVVLMTSKLCCGKHNVELDIIFNGQDFSEFEGKKNEFLMFYEDNPWIFVSLEGIIDFIGVSYIDSENIGILFNGGIKKVPENIPNVISNILENYKKAAFKTGRGFEASPFNSVTFNGYRMMLSGKIIGDEELEAEGKKKLWERIKISAIKRENKNG